MECGRVLFLGYAEDKTRLIDILRRRGVALDHTAGKVDTLDGYDAVVSFGYRHILPPPVIASARRPPVNLHIAYLPYNRGANPHFWAMVDNTPTGVTIHEIDSGIDTGPIVCQRYVNLDGGETTFAQVHKRLIREIETLFVDNMDAILGGTYRALPQRGTGSYHATRDTPAFIHGWDVDIAETVALVRRILDDRSAAAMAAIEQIEGARSGNDAAWMELLRIAMRHAPAETKRLVRKINASDNTVAGLLDQLEG